VPGCLVPVAGWPGYCFVAGHGIVCLTLLLKLVVAVDLEVGGKSMR